MSLRTYNILKEKYCNLAIQNIYNGLVEGLSNFSQYSRVALIYARRYSDPLRIYDPQQLLKEHELRLKELYFDNAAWRDSLAQATESQPDGHFITSDNLQLAGTISFGGSSRSFFYQMWFTDHHPNMCSIYPTERWLEHAGWLMSQDFSMENIAMWSSGHVLENYSLHAIEDHIVDLRNHHLGIDAKMMIQPILDIILKLSKTKEEGYWPRGRLVFLDSEFLNDLHFLAKIKRLERPFTNNIKHVRKLMLSVEYSNRILVSDGNSIIGISDSPVPNYAVSAFFNGDYGFVEIAGEPICSFFDGSFHSTTRRAKLVELEELLFDFKLDPLTCTELFLLVSKLVHTAQNKRHGATLVLNITDEPIVLSGHILDPPLDLRKEEYFNLASSLIKIDGALHIMSTCDLIGFGCLLDGKSIPLENIGRGARYNSALRFTAEHENVIVVVVSSDRPVSIIYHGIELNAHCLWNMMPGYLYQPETLKKHLNL
ncbi:MAG: DNA integrity scanning protein DisA nucleotide-binding domain protein [Desulfamplus sp.]|nr:DNA integrity scanning protein DisA nucleotide-binding domain protein [Desulfamplus sp.]MBF0411412.1 DNA integrity scanning protein DisA nucleotide-binding domain protein [Desulfamplus sp.]